MLLNTTNASRTANGFTIGAGAFELSLNGSISLLSVLSFNASFMIVVGGNQQVTFNPVLGSGDSLPSPEFSNADSETETLGAGQWYVSFSANVNFFGIATLSAYGMFDYRGQFAVGLSGGLTFGTSGFGISGNFSINACLLYGPSSPYGAVAPYFDLNGSGSVSANLFGISLASIGVGFDAQLKDAAGSVDINLSVSVSIHILFFTIGGTAHFDIGVVQFPKPFYLAGDGSGTTNGTPNAQMWNSTATNGTLYLNTGALEQYRDLGPSTDTSTASGSRPVEAYTIDDEGGNAQSGETIKVTAFGQSQTFTGVKRIVDDASDSNNIDDESLIVDPGVEVPVVFIGGPNNNTFVDNGSGYAVGYGGGSRNTSSDVNYLEAGPNVSSASWSAVRLSATSPTSRASRRS